MDDPAHAFDFWLGEWEVYGPGGKQVGRNSITAPFDTGAIAEHWHGQGGVEGHSLSSWDAERRCWHQTWVDSGGGVLLLAGGVHDGAMVLTGAAEGAEQRITWRVEDAGVRQLWETSEDDGATWVIAFDGHYRRP